MGAARVTRATRGSSIGDAGDANRTRTLLRKHPETPGAGGLVRRYCRDGHEHEGGHAAVLGDEQLQLGTGQLVLWTPTTPSAARRAHAEALAEADTH